jgi:heat-inducible transcriptional repressor
LFQRSAKNKLPLNEAFVFFDNKERRDNMKGDMHELSERKKQILKAVVEAHIDGGEPVGSKYIVQSNLLSCSSATIRNEMAELEELGYLVQPHTSAGRVPSEAGYRFYVDSLVEQYARTTHEVAQINQLLRVKMDEIDQILKALYTAIGTSTDAQGIAFALPVDEVAGIDTKSESKTEEK